MGWQFYLAGQVRQVYLHFCMPRVTLWGLLWEGWILAQTNFSVRFVGLLWATIGGRGKAAFSASGGTLQLVVLNWEDWAPFARIVFLFKKNLLWIYLLLSWWQHLSYLLYSLLKRTEFQFTQSLIPGGRMTANSHQSGWLWALFLGGSCWGFLENHEVVN